MEDKKQPMELKDGNWPVYSKRMTAFLKTKGLVTYIHEELPENASAAKVNEADRAAGFIMGSVSEKYLNMLEEDASAFEMWTILKNRFNKQDNARWLDYEEELVTLSKKPDESIIDYVGRAEDIATLLTNIDQPVKEASVVGHLLRGLPEDYNTWVTIMRRNSTTEMTIENFLNLMLEAELKLARHGRQVDPSLASTAMYTRTNSMYHKNRGRFNHQHRSHSGGHQDNSRKCYYCNERGHIQSNCPQKTQHEAAAAKLQAFKARSGDSAGGRHKKPAVARFATAYVTSAVAMEATSSGESSSWVLDSGATHHMCGDADLFNDMQKAAQDVQDITIANGAKMEVKGAGSIIVCCGELPAWELKNVLYVPELKVNLLSVSSLLMENYDVSLNSKDNVAVIWQDEDCMCVAPDCGGLYKTHMKTMKTKKPTTATACGASANKETPELWHQRLGHLSLGNVERLSKEKMVNGINVSAEKFKEAKEKTAPCEPCAMANHRKKSFPKSETKTSEVLELLHTDLCGPLLPSVGMRAQYIATFIDDYSRLAVVQPIKNKSDLARVLQDVIAQFETQTGKKVKRVRSDRGGEYIKELLQVYFRSKGIISEKTAPESPQQNGVAERFHQTLLSKVRAMMAQAGLQKNLWAELAVTANFLRNRSPVSGMSKTPYEMFFGKKPDVSFLRVIGSKAYAYRRGHQNKLEMKSIPGVLVGYESYSKGTYRVWLPDQQKIMVSRDVIFDETRGSSSNQEEAAGVKLLASKEDLDLWDNEDAANNNKPAGDAEDAEDAEDAGDAPAGDGLGGDGSEEEENNNYSSEGAATEEQESDSEEYHTALDPTGEGSADDAESDRRYPERNRKKVKPYDPSNPCAKLADGSAEVPEPATIKEAWESEQGLQWKQATDEEMASLMANNTWELVEVPPGTKVVPVKWVLKLKRGAARNIERFKARVVVKGYEQAAGVDFNEVYAPVSKYATLRAVLAVAAAHNMELHQLDIKTAFLHGELEEEIYVEQPPGYEEGGPRMVCKLKKALYGLRQAPRAWHNRLKTELEKLGFHPSDADPGMWLLRGAGERILMIVWVDDLLLAAKTTKEVTTIKQEIMKIFEARDLGEAKFFLGMEIDRDRINGTVKLSQQKYTQELLEKYGMQDAKPNKAPLKTATKLTKEDGELLDTSQSPYCALVGGLMYLAVCTRPDISQSVGALARYMAEPRKPHWEAAKGVLRYLRGTSDYGLTFGGNVEEGLVGYTDADYAGDLDTRRSTTGYAFKLFGGTVSWSRRMQPTVAVSTTEAEYMAAACAVKEALWLRKLMHDFGLTISAVKMFGDNQGALKLLKHPIASMRSKHIDIVHHFVRERVARGEVVFEYCSTESMPGGLQIA